MGESDPREPYAPPGRPLLIAAADSSGNSFQQAGYEDGLIDYASSA